MFRGIQECKSHQAKQNLQRNRSVDTRSSLNNKRSLTNRKTARRSMSLKPTKSKNSSHRLKRRYSKRRITNIFSKKELNEHRNCKDHMSCICCLDNESNIFRLIGPTCQIKFMEPLKCVLEGQNAADETCNIVEESDAEEQSENSPSNMLGSLTSINLREMEQTPKFIPPVHFRCRHLLYKKGSEDNDESAVYRRFVPDELVSWNKEWLDYYPEEWTEEKGKSVYEWCDPMINNPTDSVWFCFNCFDRVKSRTSTGEARFIDRRSTLGHYAISDRGRPINPVGRTGLQGRGFLCHWGPNHITQFVITRWKDKELGVLEFVAMYTNSMGCWCIPENKSVAGVTVPDIVKATFVTEIIRRKAKGDQIRKNEIESFFKSQHGLLIYKGYLDDPKNTDNAWIETSVLSYHDESGNILEKFSLDEYEDKPTINKVCWLPLSSDVDVWPSNRDVLLLISRRLKSSW